METIFATRLVGARQKIENISIKSPRQVVMELAQKIDDIARTLDLIITNKLGLARQKLDALASMPNVLSNKMNILNQSVLHLGQMLNSLSYKSVLSRGYAIVRDANNKIISNSGAGIPATIEFNDGVIKL